MARRVGDTGFSTFACANSLPAYAFFCTLLASRHLLAQIVCQPTHLLCKLLASRHLLAQIVCQPTHLLCKLLRQAAVLDASQIKKLIKISQTTMHAERDVTVVVLSYWLGLRAKELASLKVDDVYLPFRCTCTRQVFWVVFTMVAILSVHFFAPRAKSVQLENKTAID